MPLTVPGAGSSVRAPLAEGHREACCDSPGSGWPGLPYVLLPAPLSGLPTPLLPRAVHGAPLLPCWHLYTISRALSRTVFLNTALAVLLLALKTVGCPSPWLWHILIVWTSCVPLPSTHHSDQALPGHRSLDVLLVGPAPWPWCSWGLLHDEPEGSLALGGSSRPFQTSCPPVGP